MNTRSELTRKQRLTQTGLLMGLAGAAVLLSAPAAEAGVKGNVVNSCYGIYFSTDWNQECGPSGADYAGTYQSTADCTAPEIPDKHLTVGRIYGDKVSVDGADCAYGIHTVNTWYQ